MKGVKLTHSQPFKDQFEVSSNVSSFALIAFPLSYFRNHTVKSELRNANRDFKESDLLAKSILKVLSKQGWNCP